MANIENTSCDLQERLFYFARSFVAEVEGTLTHHYDILEGNVENSGKFIEIFSEIPIVPGLKAKPLLKPLEKPLQVIYKNKSLEFYNLVYDFKKCEKKARREFVKIAFDVFKCLEFQFGGVTSTRGLSKAMQRLGKDAAHRYINSFIKEEDDSPSNENKFLKKAKKIFTPQLPKSKPEFEKTAQRVFGGKSKSKKIGGFISIHKKLIKPGYDVQYICQYCNKSHDDWNTGNLYDEVGIIRESADSEDFEVYVREKSNHKKYGFRRSLSDENLCGYKTLDNYRFAENCEDTCIRPKYLKHTNFYDDEQYNKVLRKIDDDDDKAVKSRISKSVEILHNEFSEDMEVLKNLFESYGESAFEMFLLAQKDRDSKAAYTKENHEDLKKKVAEVSEKLDNLKQELIDQQNKKPRVLFRLKKPVKLFTGRVVELNKIHEALNQRKTTIISQIASIVGLGGIGKTELSKMYAQEHYNYYLNIIFIDSEKQDTILESFKELARHLKIDLKDKKDKERDVKVVVEEIYRVFNETGKTLMIFDNVEKYGDIKCFIFDDVSESNFIYTLINSRRQDWEVGDKGEIEVIRLNIFSDEEAMNFLEDALVNEYKEDLVTLMKLLENFPLGLKQAVGYIQQQNSKKRKVRNFTVNDYLILYREQKEKILNEGFNKTDDIYNQTVTTTWTITLQNIEENEDCGKLAISIFEIMGYLSPDHIPIEQIFTILEEDVNLIWDAVELLELYSMISIDVNRMANIHRLVQEVTRMKLRQNKNEEVVLKCSLKLLENLELEEHIVSVWEHSSDFPGLVKDFFYKCQYGTQRNTPLHLLASCRNDSVAISNILKHLKDNTIIENKNLILETPIIKAILADNLHVVKYLAELGADFYSDTFMNQTCLHHAAIKGCKNIVRYLIEKDDKLVKVKNVDGKTALYYAILKGHPNTVEILVPKNNDYFVFHARLKHAAKSKNPDEFIEIIKNAKETNYNLISSKYVGRFALEIAVNIFDARVVKYLIDCKICVNQRSFLGRTPLHFAFERGDIEIINVLLENGADERLKSNDGKSLLHFVSSNTESSKMLLEKGFDPNEPDKNGDTPFMIAVRWRKRDLIELLLDYGANPNIRNKKGDTPLIESVEYLGIETLKVLIERVDLNMTHINGETALYRSVSYELPDIFNLLLEKGADPTIGNVNKYTVIHNIVKLGKLEQFQSILKKGINLNICNADGFSLLHYAVNNTSIEILQLLLDENVDLNIPNNLGETPIFCAISCSNYKAVELLLERGADTNMVNKNGDTLLHYAAAMDQVQLFESIFKKSINTHVRNQNNETVLHWAAKGGNHDILELLLKDKIDLNVTDSGGLTPLHYAALHGNFHSMITLLYEGADSKVVSFDGNALLHFAAYKFNNVELQVIERLGFDLTSANSNGKSLLHNAVNGSNASAVIFFLERRIKPNITDVNLRTPLHCAVLTNDLEEIAKLLIRNGADLNAADNFGCTPLHYAVEKSKYYFAEMLIEEGADINARDKLGRTALHKYPKNSIPFVNMMLKNGADVNILDKYGRSPLYYMAIAKNLTFPKFNMIALMSTFGTVKLDKAGLTLFHVAVVYLKYPLVKDILERLDDIDVNVRDNSGRTPLHMAAARGRVGIVALLIRNGADIDAIDDCGDKPLQSAIEKSRVKVIEFLKKKHNESVST
ncbi:uncharacterized protein LOC143919459 [Arctopsyche grandis]|uniref:uncharacterized protein LOC143919459 n=1 Tax=Arctopsyche grandis TaxID=121162 RepID=UPI00406D7EC5